jgi:radical SAM superfamily enzyme YgiQ (UPF0313 family)
MAFQSLLLIVPPQLLVMEGFRSALVALASYMKRNLPRLDIRILDLSSVHPTKISSSLSASLVGMHGRIIAGISTVTADYQAALKIATELKKLDRSIVTVLGGHHASGDAEVILSKQDKIDYVICNEGEVPLYHLIKSYPVAERVPGLAFRDGNGIKRNPAPPLLSQRDLDLVPLTYEGCELSTSPGKFDHVTYVSARGCPLKCAFCAVANQEIRSKSIPQVSADIRALVDKGFSKLAIEDNFFAHSVKRTQSICEALAELRATGFAFSWDCQTRVESMDRPGMIGNMERAGCDAIYLGVESLDEQSLQFLAKTPNPASYLRRLQERVVPALLASEINCFINLQFGLPGEDDTQIEKTFQRVKQLGEMAARRGREITIFPQLFVVYPGTYHFKDFVRAKLISADIFEKFTPWEAEQKPILEWLGETFAHGTGGLPIGLLDDRRLRDGKFTIDGGATIRVAQTIRRLDELPGINVFHYGQYLVKGERP